MAEPTLDIHVLAGYVDVETERWREWFTKAPAAVLDLPLGPGSDGTVRSLIKHIFAVELRYAERMIGDPVTEYEQLADRTVDELWEIHEAAAALRNRFLLDASEEDLERVLISVTRKLGQIESRVQVVLLHSLIHGIRHWAQIAMVLRQHGYGEQWEHDWLVSPAVQ